MSTPANLNPRAAKTAKGELSARGADFNGTTSFDRTNYFETLTATDANLKWAIEMEADRMVNTLITTEEFAKEIKVVMEERRMRTDDRARSVVYEQLMATALRAHPYRIPTVGWMNDLQNMTAEDARDFYEKWYAPNNATLVIATHDVRVATRAPRVVELVDGQLK